MLNAAPNFKLFVWAAQVHSQQGQVGDALVALALEVVFSSPEAVEAGIVHLLGKGHGVVQGLRQLLVGVPAPVGVPSVGANVVEVNLTHIQN